MTSQRQAKYLEMRRSCVYGIDTDETGKEFPFNRDYTYIGYQTKMFPGIERVSRRYLFNDGNPPWRTSAG